MVRSEIRYQSGAEPGQTNGPDQKAMAGILSLAGGIFRKAGIRVLDRECLPDAKVKLN